MSSYPKKAQKGGYECQACYEIWEDPVDAKDCCPPRHRLVGHWSKAIGAEE